MVKNKIMFFDIDGTLLSETTHTIPESTIVGLNKAKENGHMIFINTGRPFSSIDECIKNLNPDGYVCGCGTYIRYHDDVLFSQTLSSKRCQEIKNLLRVCKIDAILEGKSTVYFDKNIRNARLNEIKTSFQNTSTFNVSSFDDPELSFDKFAIWFDNNSDIKRFRQEIASDFNYIARASNFGEIVPQGCSKATGIKFLLEYFNMNNDDAYVFGDSFNDQTMLEYVKHAIVMGNGESSLFNLAYYVTKDIEDDGIYHALEYLKLI